MAFYIYYHWVSNKQNSFHSTIHLGKCRFCNNGKGFRNDKTEGLIGKWVGSFKTYEEAHRQASTYEGKTFEVLDCKRCKPNIHRNVDEI